MWSFGKASLSSLEGLYSTSSVASCDVSVGDTSVDSEINVTSPLIESDEEIVDSTPKRSISKEIAKYGDDVMLISTKSVDVVKSYETVAKLSQKISQMETDSPVIRSYGDSNENMAPKLQNEMKLLESEHKGAGAAKSYEAVAKLSAKISQVETGPPIIKSYHDSNENMALSKPERNPNGENDAVICQRESVERIRLSKVVQHTSQMFIKKSENSDHDIAKSSLADTSDANKKDSQSPERFCVKSVKNTAKLFASDSSPLRNVTGESLSKLDKRDLDSTKPASLGRISVLSTSEVFARNAGVWSHALTTSSDGKLFRVNVDVSKYARSRSASDPFAWQTRRSSNVDKKTTDLFNLYHRDGSFSSSSSSKDTEVGLIDETRKSNNEIEKVRIQF